MSAATTTRRRVRPSPASEAWMLLFEFFKAQKPRFDSLAAEFDLSQSQAHALYVLGEPRSMSELAHLLSCDASNVTGIVDRLESRGLLERRPSEHDRRVKMLVLTDAGTGLRGRALEQFFAAPPGIAALPAADQRALRDLLLRALGR